MTRFIAYGSMLAFGVLSISLIAARPDWVGDGNAFLKNFVNHEFINVLGVTLAITLASAAQIHLAINRIEERHKVRNAFANTRRELRQSTYWLIAMFALGVSVVTIKPIASSGASSEGFFNMLALFILLFHVLLLVSLTQLVFAIPPDFTADDERKDDPN